VDFYEAQAQARRRTRRLVVLFALTLAFVVAMLTVLTLFVVFLEDDRVATPATTPTPTPTMAPPDRDSAARPEVAPDGKAPGLPPASMPSLPGAGIDRAPGTPGRREPSGQPDAAEGFPDGAMAGGEPLSPARSGPGVRELVTRDPGTTRTVVLVWLLLLLVPVLVRSIRLSRSGAVARWLGGTALAAEPRDPRERMLLNVVEEMSIASGVPVPRIYVLREESAINAFAAGFSPSDATLAVTGGALLALDREQLQGVIAHEFSHILNGDMRMNVRLIAWISGLFAIARIPLRVARWVPGKGVPFVLLVLSPLAVVGSVGGILGRLLQAGISRQREWLADASAVQFTRNPDGLRRALVTIGRHGGTGLLRTPVAQEAAHLFFVPPVRRCFSTHPSLHRRIRALERAAAPVARQGDPAPQLAGAGAEGRTPWGLRPSEVPVAFGVAVPAAAVGTTMTSAAFATADRAGEVDLALAEQARALLESLPPVVREAKAPEEAQAVLLAIALSSSGNVQRAQRQAIERALEPRALATVVEYRDRVRSIPVHSRLPAAQYLFPRVRELPAAGRETLAALLSRLAQADGELDLFEFCLARLASTWLRDSVSRREPSGRRHLADVRPALGTLLSVLATFGHEGDEPTARRAFAAGAALFAPRLGIAFERPASWAATLWRAFDRLDTLAPADRRLVIAAMAAVVMHDGRLETAEADLLRTACAALHCPLPLPRAGPVALAAGLP